MKLKNKKEEASGAAYQAPAQPRNVVTITYCYWYYTYLHILHFKIIIIFKDFLICRVPPCFLQITFIHPASFNICNNVTVLSKLFLQDEYWLVCRNLRLMYWSVSRCLSCIRSLCFSLLKLEEKNASRKREGRTK